MNRTTRALLAVAVAAGTLTACSVTVDSRPSTPTTPPPAVDTTSSDLTDDQRATLLTLAFESASPSDQAVLCRLWERDGGGVVAASLNESLDADQRLTAAVVDHVFEEEC